METAQQVGQGTIGDGIVCLGVGIIAIIPGIRVMINGTTSEEAQRRNIKRRKENK